MRKNELLLDGKEKPVLREDVLRARERTATKASHCAAKVTVAAETELKSGISKQETMGPQPDLWFRGGGENFLRQTRDRFIGCTS